MLSPWRRREGLGHGLAGGAVDGSTGGRAQGVHAADMVAVMVRD
jgi:hypothetical protein